MVPVSARADKVEGEDKILLASASVLGESPASPLLDALRLANESPSYIVWVLFKLLWMCGVLGCVSVQGSPPEHTLNSLWFFRSPGWKACWSSKSDVLGLIPLVQVPRAGVPDMRHKPLPLIEKLCSCDNFSWLQVAVLGLVFLVRSHLFLSYHLDVDIVTFVVHQLFS